MSSECVKVMVRARPINQREINEGSKFCIEIDKKVNQVVIKRNAGEDKAFSFDAVYDWNSSQRLVYDESAFPLVESVLEGYNGTIFAYGQTGCGKTHTMMGQKDAGPEHRGIIPNAFEHIFGFIDQCPNTSSGQMKFLVRCSYLEIYNEDIRDLLSSKQNLEHKLELKEDPNRSGVFVKDLTCCIVKSIPEIEKLMTHGSSQRKVGETAMNKDSSRSHSIFTIYIETSETDTNGESRIKAGKLNLVDLAGSERQSKTQAQGIRLKEATKINLSLSALGNVISALVDGKSHHIPYRDSKLTRLLQDSLGGNTKTVMIAAISPSDFNYEESLSTLRYAARAKSIKNKPRVNEDPKDALLKEYEEEIKKLKQLLEQNNAAGGNAMINLQNAQLGRRQVQEHIVTAAANMEEESVDQLIEKLAKKGKKVKIINESEQSQTINNEEENPSDISPQINKKIQRKRLQNANSIAEVENEEEDNNSHQFFQEESAPPIKQPNVKKIGSKRTIIRDSSDMSHKAPQESQPQQPTSFDLQSALNDTSLSKDQLQQMIKEMEQRLVVGGSSSNVVNSQEEKDRLRQQRALQIKLRNEKKKQKALIEEKLKQEEELLLKQQQYSSLQEEVDQNRRIVESLRSKYKQVSQDLKDVREEAEEHKETMLETIREQEHEIEFLNLVMKALLKDFELQNLREKSRYDDNNQRWVLPTFYVKDKVIQLPRLGVRNADSLIQTELDKRDFIVQESSQYQDSDIDRFDSTPGFGNTMIDGTRGIPSQKSKRGVMNDTYYNNANSGGFGGSRKTGQGFVRHANGGKAAVSDMMRQSRMSVGVDNNSLDRGTPIEPVRGAASGPRAGKFKQPIGGSRLTMDTNQESQNQFSTLVGGLPNSESEISLNKKNMKSNVHLQPLNYKSNMPNPGIQNVAQGIEEILKNHQIQLSNVSQDGTGVYGNIPNKKSQLGKIGGHQMSLNLNPSDSSTTMNGPTPGGGFHMSIQATVSIEPTNNGGYLAPRRPQLAPIQNSSPPQNTLKSMAIDNTPQIRLNGAISGQGNNNNQNNSGPQVFRKNRVFLSGMNNNNHGHQQD